MIAPNPFLERNFTTSNVSNYSHDRHYFPTLPTKYHKPGFLVSTVTSFPTIGDSRSPYFSLSGNESRGIKKYTQNPFHKGHLLEDSTLLSSSSRLYSSSYTDLGYTPLHMSSSYANPIYTSNVYEGYNPSKTYANNEYPVKRKGSSPENPSKVTKRDTFSNENWGSQGLYEQNSYERKKSEGQGLGRKESRGSRGSMGGRAEGEDQELARLLKKQSSGNYNKISEHPNEEDEDSPLNYNLPSSILKPPARQESASSPTWPNQYQPLNEERETGSWMKTNENQGIQANSWDRQESQGIQTRNIRMEGVPKEISYQGKGFYLLNTDEL